MNLSPTKLSAMSKCPYSFKMQYINNVRKVKESASLLFGQSIHDAVEAGILQQGDPVQVFTEKWGEYETKDLQYSSKDGDWTTLNQKGLAMAEDFKANYLNRFLNVYQVEGDLSFEIDQQTRLYGRLDYVGDFVTDDGEIVKAIVDFKTSASKYSESDIQFNDQLTGYTIGAKRYPFEVEALVLVVFVKTKTPYIQVIVAEKRSEKEIKDYMETARYHLENIYRDRYPKIKADHCGWCDYGVLCIGKGSCEDLKVQVRKLDLVSGRFETEFELFGGRLNLVEIFDDESPKNMVRRILRENNVPAELEMGFEVIKHHGNGKSRRHFYWWNEGRLVKTDAPQEAEQEQVEEHVEELEVA